MYDIVKGFDYIGDQDVIEYMCFVGFEVVFEFEYMGLLFFCIEIGCIYQCLFGGQFKDFGKGGQVVCICVVVDCIGYVLLYILYQVNLKNGILFFNEWYVVDLVKNQDGVVVGIIVICIEIGEIVYICFKVVVLVIGGVGCIYVFIINVLINIGDGVGMVLCVGVLVQDIEMWQFYLIGIVGVGVLVIEGCCGEGGYLINVYGECFMECYVLNVKDLVGCDVVVCFMVKEVLVGNGVGLNKDYVLLKFDYFGEEVLYSCLFGICELFKIFVYVDLVVVLILVILICYYMMGGVVINIYGQVIIQDVNGNDQIVEGLFVVGEVVCVLVYGVNCLGGNLLFDLVVFGCVVGLYLEKVLKEGIDVCGVFESDLEVFFKCLNGVNECISGEEVVLFKCEL